MNNEVDPFAHRQKQHRYIIRLDQSKNSRIEVSLNLSSFFTSFLRTLKSFKYLTKAIKEKEIPRRDLLDLMDSFSLLDESTIMRSERVCFTTFATSKVGRSHYLDVMMLMQRNPEYRFVFFNDSEVSSWMKKYTDPEIYEIFTKIQYKASQIDVFRLCLIYHYGGIFLSLNRIIEKPFGEFVFDPMKLVIAFESNLFTRDNPSTTIPKDFANNQVVQWAIIGPKGHKFFEFALQEILEFAPTIRGKKVSSVKEAIWDFSAPRSLTRALDKYLNQYPHADITFCGQDYLGSGREAHGAYVRYISNPSYLGDVNSIVIAL